MKGREQFTVGAVVTVLKAPLPNHLAAGEAPKRAHGRAADRRPLDRHVDERAVFLDHDEVVAALFHGCIWIVFDVNFRRRRHSLRQRRVSARAGAQLGDYLIGDCHQRIRTESIEKRYRE